ncbi:hypothetical protein SPRG_08590 [Saprolegnia parasitica CBS 223.65]|uniref:Uncharacterized protein n=1 Tax=Saprolegnia parasitica (strain CBS 223.65) TaxID=695850 RepID=A0A067C9S8_SAPPC|nr:hypothetical protein SPRG_08590 [Saprolegnia parasitica CBS 223.65]KDO25935.1 hypothetical protein SPRG_08590 [Saprolegnia parasitica CBS 223.65]|eukprot:XP_012203224.1 hypothetical protein SPRG_08590 [Saprolegnia parasitica CBS 223.65]
MKDIVLKQKLRKGRRKARRKSGEESYQERRNNSAQQTRDRKKQARKRLRMVQTQRALDKQTELVRNCPIHKKEVAKRAKGPLQQHEWKLRGAARPAALLARIANGECDADGNEFKAPEKTVDLFETMPGKFGEREETVEYLRLRKEVALATCQAGMMEDGIAHFEACLELDPTDTVCAREGLVCALVDEGRADEARVFLDKFETTTAILEYCRVIIEYVSWEVLEEEGSSEELVQAAFEKAWSLNPYIAMFIAGYESFNAVVEYVDEIKAYDMGSIEESFLYCATNIGVWLDTVGAQAWIQKEIDARDEPSVDETKYQDEMYLGMYTTAVEMFKEAQNESNSENENDDDDQE